jgi:hypothetical protein
VAVDVRHDRRLESGILPGMTHLYLATSPDRYPSFVARESGVLILVAVLSVTAALAAVHLRRPE